MCHCQKIPQGSDLSRLVLRPVHSPRTDAYRVPQPLEPKEATLAHSGPWFYSRKKEVHRGCHSMEVAWGGFGFVPGCHLSVAGYSEEAASH